VCGTSAPQGMWPTRARGYATTGVRDRGPGPCGRARRHLCWRCWHLRLDWAILFDRGRRPAVRQQPLRDWWFLRFGRRSWTACGRSCLRLLQQLPLRLSASPRTVGRSTPWRSSRGVEGSPGHWVRQACAGCPALSSKMAASSISRGAAPSSGCWNGSEQAGSGTCILARLAQHGQSQEGGFATWRELTSRMCWGCVSPCFLLRSSVLVSVLGPTGLWRILSQVSSFTSTRGTARWPQWGSLCSFHGLCLRGVLQETHHHFY